jgi:hypothetical protein
MTGTSIFCKDSKRVVGPGDKAAQLCDRPPLGYCNASTHLMGFWHNERAAGPVIYLNTVQLTAPVLPMKMPPSARRVFARTDMSSLNPLCRSSLTETPKMPRPPRSLSTRLKSQLFSHNDEYDSTSEELRQSPVSFRASDGGRSPSCPSLLSMRGVASFMSQASTVEMFDSDDEELETDRDHTPPIASPKRSADATWVTCGPRAGDEWAKPAQGKTPAFMRPVQLPGDKALRTHPNPTVRSLFKN